MDGLVSSLQRTRPRRAAGAVCTAIAIHVLLALALVSQAPRPTPMQAQTTIVISLAAPARPAQAPRALPRQAPLPAGPTAASPAPPALAPRPSVAASAPPQVPVLPVAPAPPDRADDLRRALNAEFGCDRPGGPAPEDRARCAERLAAARAPARAFGIDPAQRAYFDAAADRALWWQQPFLATIPKNGCAPLVTNRQIAFAGGRAASDWRVGIGCGKSF